MKVEGGINAGNVISWAFSALSAVAVAGWIYGQFGAILADDAKRIATLEGEVGAITTAIADIRVNYASAAALHELSIEQRQALAPLQAKQDQTLDRVNTVAVNQAETATAVKALTDRVTDLQRAVERRDGGSARGPPR